MLVGLLVGSGVLLLVVAILVAGIAFSQPPVAQVPQANNSDAAPPGPPPPPAPTAFAPPGPPPASTAPGATASHSTFASPPTADSAGATATGTPTHSGASGESRDSGSSTKSAFREAPAGEVGLTFLPTAVHAWQSEGQARRGLIRVGDSEVPLSHFSWMTQLLPFLGHQREYDRLDFRQKLLTDRNLQIGTEVIPAFLNPLDDRQVWKGHPFDGLALTHFAGMSGIEDSRNVVAATLPRDDPRAGVFGYDAVARPEEITDGTSQTIMIVGSGALANPWIMGGGGTIRGARQPYFDKVSGLGTRNLPQPGTLAVMADGSVRFVSSNVDPQVFRAMCTIHGRDTVDLEQATQPFLLESLEK